MKASVVQSLLARNRKDIHFYEVQTKHWKDAADEYFDKAEDEIAYSFVKDIRQFKKQIAKLVEIQKELKKELQAIYNKEAGQRFYEHICLGSIFKVDSDE